MTKGASGYHSGAIVRFDNLLFVVGMGLAFCRTDEAGAHLNARRAKCKRRGYATTIPDASCGNDWNVYSINHLRHQRQRRYVTDMSARFHSFCD
jgi:hypothetical protein